MERGNVYETLFMNKHLLGFTALLLTASTCHADVPLLRDGRPLAKIYLAPQPPLDPKKPASESALQGVVRDLNYHLQKMSGAGLEVVETADPAQIKAPAVVLGELAVKLGATPQKASESKEGFRLLTKNNMFLIGGESDEGAVFGAYELLSRLGCDWVMPGEIGEIIPRKTTVSAPDADESSAPDFLIRGLWYRGYDAPRLPDEGTRMAAWMRRQKKGSFTHPALNTSGHAWGSFISQHKAEFDKDPTMYALTRAADGTLKRMGPQLETTHPRVIELFVQDIKDTYTKNIWPKDKVAGFGVGPSDGLGYSMSSEAVAAGSGRIDPVVGDPDQTDLLILFANEILKRLEGEYPNVYVGYYSYSTHADYPMRYKPHPHLVQIFAPINFSRFHSLTDRNSKSQTYYRSVVEQWGKLSREQGNWLVYRGYNWNLAENMMPYSKLRIWGEELPFYKQQGILGLNVEATKAWSINGPSDYVFMKLSWNSAQDWKKLLAEYCRKSFGAGAAPMERYFLRLTETQHNSGQEAGSYAAFHLMYDDAFVAAAKKDFAQATTLAKNAEEKTRIAHFAASIEALRLYLNYFKATTEYDFAKAQTGYQAMLDFWKKTYDTNTDLVANETPSYLKRFVGAFVDASAKYSTGEYKIAERLPDELQTMHDPHIVGHRMGYQNPELNDRGFAKTKTYTSTWDAQGLTGLRSGAVWYRHRFRLAKELKGKPVGLFLGGFEDEARVWINGRVVGTSGQRFSMPVAYDLTEGINYDGENMVAIQVIRNSAANEIGLGGIIRPGFIFTGPRLATKAPAPLELRRILPGGELGEVEK